MSEEPNARVHPGQTVYDEDGVALGSIRGINEDGFNVSSHEGIEGLSVSHEHSEPDFGEAELLWRCLNCGELGDVEDIPDECPTCGAPKEDLYYYIED